MEFRAAGVGYYKKALVSVAHKGAHFGKSDKQILKICPEGKPTFKYYFNDCKAGLVPEPTNRHDKNAVMITLDGKCVGYVPANLCWQAKLLMRHPYDLKVNVRGGPAKVVHAGEVYREDRDYNIYVTLTPQSKKQRDKTPVTLQSLASSLITLGILLILLGEWRWSIPTFLLSLLFTLWDKFHKKSDDKSADTHQVAVTEMESQNESQEPVSENDQQKEGEMLYDTENGSGPRR